jgi:hypothetical protein
MGCILTAFSNLFYCISPGYRRAFDEIKGRNGIRVNYDSDSD